MHLPQRLAIYPGSFDPITLGHLDVIKRSLRITDTLIIAIGDNNSKSYMFSNKDRLSIVEHVLKEEFSIDDLSRIKVQGFSGLLVDFAKLVNASFVIRGIRALSDFDYEFNMAGANSKLYPDMETVFLITSETSQFISASFVKEIHKHGGDISSFVPSYVVKKMSLLLK